MKKVPILILFSVLALWGKAQTVDQYVLDNYSSDIINKIYDLVAKTNINGSKQIAIANILQQQTTEVNTMIRNNQPKTAIDSINKIYQNSWRAIFSTTDEFYYSTETIKENKILRYSYTLLSLALERRETLNLSSPLADYLLSKLDSLKVQEDLFYQQNPNQVFNSYNLQNKYINAVFTDEQYKKLIEIKNKDRDYSKAKIDWEALVSFNLAEGLNVDSTLAQFANYYLAKDYIYGRYQQNLNVRRQQLQRLYDTEPDAVRKLYYARKYKDAHFNNKPLDFSQLLFAIKNTDKLNLSAEQTKDLFAKANELEKLKEEAYSQDTSKPYDSKRYECENLKQILTADQLDMLLILKNLGKAKNLAAADWRELTERNMIAGHNMDSTITQLTNYYFQRQCIYDRNEDNKILQAEILNELYANKPPALLALIKARKNPDNNTQGQGYSW